ncbi:MAG: photosynthetic reaction center cytochrome PufC [Polynucleobacter sp.]
MKTIFAKFSLLSILFSMLLLAGCERPPIEAVQHGYRGTAMDLIYNPRTLAAQAPDNVVPASYPVPADGPKAATVYKNVKVLGNLSTAQFTAFMVSMTSWVSPQQGCAYCHNVENFADDSKYTKTVSRRMIQMNQRINSNWQTHVKQTGVTCYTCHRGNNIPQQVWFTAPEQKQGNGWLGNKNGQNTPSQSVGLSSLPYDPFTPFLLKDSMIEVNGDTALRTDNKRNIKDTEKTFGLMIHMSKSLGVNCSYCHNTRAIASWKESPPQRATAWYGIRMAQDINNNFMVPLTSVFPAHRLGPTGDVAKANCATCHQGAYKPLYGVSMLANFPYLRGTDTTTAASTSGAANAAVK